MQTETKDQILVACNAWAILGFTFMFCAICIKMLDVIWYQSKTIMKYYAYYEVLNFFCTIPTLILSNFYVVL